MKKLQAILSFGMIAVLLFSVTGFSVDRMYCKGNLVDERFYRPADHCNGKAGCDDTGPSFRSDCCENQSLHISGIEVQSAKVETKALPVFPGLHMGLGIDHGNFRLIARDLHYKAPPPPTLPSGRQILLLAQRFLI